MKLLLDTRTVIWWATDDQQLSARAIAAVEHAENVTLFSAVVAWEIAIKRASDKLMVDDADLSLLMDGGAMPLLIDFDHVRGVERLPDHHRDPFDRLLISQALIEDATIVTSDPLFGRYDVPVLW